VTEEELQFQSDGHILF